MKKRTARTKAKPTPALKLDKHNARKHGEANLAMIGQSLDEVGPFRSIAVDRDGIVRAGEGVYTEAQKRGLKVRVVKAKPDELIAVQRDDLHGARAQRAALFDNRTAELSEWNPDVLAALKGSVRDGLWTAGELEAFGLNGGDNRDVDAEPQLDRAEALRAKWRTALGQLWALGEHRLICGDCTDRAVVERVMGGEKAEMVWTDPPYGVAVGDKNKYLNSIAPSNRVEDNLENDTLDEQELTTMLCAAFDNAVAACTAGAAWYVAAPAGPLHVLFGQVLKDRRIWRQTIQWVKNNSTFSPMGVCYHWRAEPIFFGWLPNAGHRYYGGRTQTTVWEIDRPTKSPEHPTMKPVELVARAIENSSQRGELVLDVFVGSGTTVIACEHLGRRCRAVEISPAYVAVALQRYLDATGKTPELIDEAKAKASAKSKSTKRAKWKASS